MRNREEFKSLVYEKRDRLLYEELEQKKKLNKRKKIYAALSSAMAAVIVMAVVIPNAGKWMNMGNMPVANESPENSENDGNGGFEDWYLEFADECDPDRIEIAPNGLQTGVRTAYPLAERRLIPLRREDYAVDGIFLADMARRITLKSATSRRSVTLNYPQMPYLGIWQPGGCDAPFICIEPWCGLPDYHNRALDFSQKAQMFHLPSGCSANTGFEIIFE